MVVDGSGRPLEEGEDPLLGVEGLVKALCAAARRGQDKHISAQI